MKQPKPPKYHNPNKISLWLDERSNILRILSPDGKVQFYSLEPNRPPEFMLSAFSEPTSNEALVDLKLEHTFLGYL